jgi:hypothetical protein
MEQVLAVGEEVENGEIEKEEASSPSESQSQSPSSSKSQSPLSSLSSSALGSAPSSPSAAKPVDPSPLAATVAASATINKRAKSSKPPLTQEERERARADAKHHRTIELLHTVRNTSLQAYFDLGQLWCDLNNVFLYTPSSVYCLNV